MNEQMNRLSQTPAEVRPAVSSMTELASCIGDLETALRALAARVSPLLPSGSPFERPTKDAVQGAQTNAAPRPVRSHFTDELQSRIYALRSITSSVNEMIQGIEI